MTHDELLAEINRLDGVLTDSYGISALRAVVEYHTPYESKNYGLLCRGCDEDPNYPCGTILAIEKELQ
jgi:hypothetical protein